jgi:hypothetical protein
MAKTLAVHRRLKRQAGHVEGFLEEPLKHRLPQRGALRVGRLQRLALDEGAALG